MENGINNKQYILARIFTSAIVLPVLFTLLTALFSSIVSAQEPQDPQKPKIYYLKYNQEQSNHWEQDRFWYEANGSGTQSVVPSGVTNSIFVVGDVFHLRPNRPNGPVYYPEVGKYDTTFGYYHGIGSHTNKLYIGYKVDLDTGTVDLNDYSEGIYGVLHLKTQARGSNKGNITVDDLYVGHGEIFHGETGSTINFHGSVTVQGDLRFRNVAEDKITDIRILNIYNEIHGDGILQFEAGVVAGDSSDNHVAEIYLMSSENDFSGKVFVESGSYVHIDDEHEMHKYYDYQTHLYITGENALYKAVHVLNEGFIYALADQRFKNYDGDDSYGQFTGVGELIVNPGVNVELLYDNPDLSYEPIGLITVNNENNNPGTLIFNIPEGMTKTIFMTEDPAEYSKIGGKGNLVKTGDGTLQIVSAAAELVGPESFVISSGRLDMEGYFAGSILVGDDTLADGEIFSSGAPDPEDIATIGTANIEGELILYDSAILLMEIGGTEMDKNDQLIIDAQNITFNPGSVVKFELVDDYDYQPKNGDVIEVKMPYLWNKDNVVFSSQAFILSYYDSETGIQYLEVNPNYVPEPSTWALLILGAAGIAFFARRKRLK